MQLGSSIHSNLTCHSSSSPAYCQFSLCHVQITSFFYIHTCVLEREPEVVIADEVDIRVQSVRDTVKSVLGYCQGGAEI
jgi:hypothetical protein